MPLAVADETPPAAPPTVPVPAPTPPPAPLTAVIEPGLTLTRMWLANPDGPVAMYVVRAARKSGWAMQIAPADPLALKRAPVTKIARDFGATVAVNGGYFAFGGAAVGAVAVDGEWIRLPWKDRTALGFDAKGRVKIDVINAAPTARFGDATVAIDNLNGFPGTGASVLTPRFGTTYKLKPEQSAIEVVGGKVTARLDMGETRIAPGGWVLVAGAAARAALQNVAIGDAASWQVAPAPAEWGQFPQILGAGPRLLRAGQIEVTDVAENFRPDVVWRGPRTAVGIDRAGDIVIVVVDGRQAHSVGLRLPDLARQMQALGVVDALSFDGGSSAVLVIKDQIINKPSQGKEVYVANALLLRQAPAPNAAATGAAKQVGSLSMQIHR